MGEVTGAGDSSAGCDSDLTVLSTPDEFVAAAAGVAGCWGVRVALPMESGGAGAAVVLTAARGDVLVRDDERLMAASWGFESRPGLREAGPCACVDGCAAGTE